MSITIKSAEDIAGMRVACRLASEVLDAIAPHIQPGITTRRIDEIAATRPTLRRCAPRSTT